MEFLYALEKLRVPILNCLFLGISHLGSEVASVILVFVIYWCVSKKKGYFVLANILFSLGINQILKLHFHVPRPFVKDPNFTIADGARSTATGHSFPSGHTQNSTALYGSVFVVMKQRAVRIVCAAMIVLVAFSRMYLGAHYPTDVLGGFVCGMAVLILMLFLFKRFEDRPGFLPVLFWTGTVVLIAAALMFEAGPWKSIGSPEEMPEMLQGIGICAGCMLGVAVGAPIERRFVRFETRAVWWAQILKAGIGLALFGGLILVMKIPAEALFGSSSLRYVLWFFVPSLFAVCVWPLTFRWFCRHPAAAV